METCLKLFQSLIAAHEYFPTCSVLNEIISAAEIILFQLQSLTDMVTCEIKHFSVLFHM